MTRREPPDSYDPHRANGRELVGAREFCAGVAQAIFILFPDAVVAIMNTRQEEIVVRPAVHQDCVSIAALAARLLANAVWRHAQDLTTAGREPRRRYVFRRKWVLPVDGIPSFVLRGLRRATEGPMIGPLDAQIEALTFLRAAGARAALNAHVKHQRGRSNPPRVHTRRPRFRATDYTWFSSDVPF